MTLRTKLLQKIIRKNVFKSCKFSEGKKNKLSIHYYEKNMYGKQDKPFLSASRPNEDILMSGSSGTYQISFQA
jgi:hypothetical protein